MKRIAKVIWMGVIPGIAGGYLVSRLLRPSPAMQGLMGRASAGREVADDLEVINGIGPVFARRLHAAGIHTFADLVAASPDRLLQIVQAAPGLADPESWREQAGRLI